MCPFEYRGTGISKGRCRVKILFFITTIESSSQQSLQGKVVQIIMGNFKIVLESIWSEKEEKEVENRNLGSSGTESFVYPLRTIIWIHDGSIYI